MLNFNRIISIIGLKYSLIKKSKGIDVPTEINSDQLKATIQILIEEINKELEKRDIELYRLKNDVDKVKKEIW